MVKTRSGAETNLIIDNPENTTTMATVTNEQLQISINNLTKLIQTNNTTLTADIHSIQSDITEIKEVTNESEALKEQLYSTQGRVARLESKNVQLEEKLVSHESRTYDKDLMFYNVKDNPNETFITLKESIYNVIRNDMKIPEYHICSKTNPIGEIRLDTVTRIGKYKADYSRPVVANFVTKSGRNIVYSRTYTSNLTGPIRVRVAEHYPAIVREKRQHQLETLKHIKGNFKNTTTKVVMSKDRILVDGKPRNREAFVRNPLPSISPMSINYEKLQHSEVTTDHDSTFQAQLLPIYTKNQASAALNAIYQNPALSTATHIMYAYKIGKNGESPESGFSDDDEIGGGSLIMSLIEIENSNNVFVCVTRKKKGPNIGPARFTHIKSCTQELLQHVQPADPDFNNIVFNI